MITVITGKQRAGKTKKAQELIGDDYAHLELDGKYKDAFIENENIVFDIEAENKKHLEYFKLLVTGKTLNIRKTYAKNAETVDITKKNFYFVCQDASIIETMKKDLGQRWKIVKHIEV